MKWLAAVLTFVNFATIAGLLTGMAERGLSSAIATFAIAIGIVAAVIAWWATERDAATPRAVEQPSPASEIPLTRRALKRRKKESPVIVPARQRYRFVWLWLMAGCFAIFAGRSFCWLLFLDGNEWRIQSTNNLGDLSLHLTYIKYFASGVPLWPDNPIYVFSKLRYPAGVDLFNGLLTCAGVDVARGLIWTGLLASAATCYAFYRWAGTFGIAAFLFNGGVAGYEFLKAYTFSDYQGVNSIAWKSIPLAMFVTQRGLLYAIPAGLILLYQWRARYLQDTAPAEAAAAAPPGASAETVAPSPRPPLPFWLELSIYASMPLFHVHTFMVLSIVLVFLFLFGHRNLRMQLLFLVGAALIPATFFVWVISDNFHAGSVMQWKPGWVQQAGEFAMPFFKFWLVNFGGWGPLVLFFVGITGWNAWKRYKASDFKMTVTLAFVAPAIFIFLLGYLVKTAPWEWDNIKIIVWAYFLILPFLWTDLIARWPFYLRVPLCFLLFASGFITLIGGLKAGRPGFGIMERTELDAVGSAVRKLPVEARYAGFPIYNHPILLQGRRMVLGYPGHTWTQGFNTSEVDGKLQGLMNGAAGWKENARFLQTRYLFWGRPEKANYQASTRPWERESKQVASGDWGAIYDLEAPAQQPAAPPRQ
jgi:hypothetical protein